MPCKDLVCIQTWRDDEEGGELIANQLRLEPHALFLLGTMLDEERTFCGFPRKTTNSHRGKTRKAVMLSVRKAVCLVR